MSLLWEVQMSRALGFRRGNGLLEVSLTASASFSLRLKLYMDHPCSVGLLGQTETIIALLW